MLKMFLEKMIAQTEKQTGFIAKIQITLAELRADRHKTPCEAHTKLSELVRSDIGALHEKVNSHVQDGHAENIKATVADRRDDEQANRSRWEIVLIAAGIIASILIAIFK